MVVNNSRLQSGSKDRRKHRKLLTVTETVSENHGK